MIGGPFESHIEHIIRDKAYSMNSPVVSACDPGIKSAIKCFGREDGNPYQTSDILIQARENLEMVSSFCPFLYVYLNFVQGDAVR